MWTSAVLLPVTSVPDVSMHWALSSVSVSQAFMVMVSFAPSNKVSNRIDVKWFKHSTVNSLRLFMGWLIILQPRPFVLKPSVSSTETVFRAGWTRVDSPVLEPSSRSVTTMDDIGHYRWGLTDLETCDFVKAFIT